jgi:hypothetical protein
MVLWGAKPNAAKSVTPPTPTNANPANQRG